MAKVKGTTEQDEILFTQNLLRSNLTGLKQYVAYATGTPPDQLDFSFNGFLNFVSQPSLQFAMTSGMLAEGGQAFKLVADSIPALRAALGTTAAAQIVYSTYELATNHQNMTLPQIIQTVGLDAVIVGGTIVGLKIAAKAPADVVANERAGISTPNESISTSTLDNAINARINESAGKSAEPRIRSTILFILQLLP